MALLLKVSSEEAVVDTAVESAEDSVAANSEAAAVVPDLLLATDPSTTDLPAPKVATLTSQDPRVREEVAPAEVVLPVALVPDPLPAVVPPSECEQQI